MFDKLNLGIPHNEQELAARFPALKREWIRGFMTVNERIASASAEDMPLYAQLVKIAFRVFTYAFLINST